MQPSVPSHCKHSFHMYYLLLPNNKSRNNLINYLSKLQIKAVSHYQSLHNSPFAKKNLNYKINNCPVSNDISQRIIRLPLFYNMTVKQQTKVINDIVRFHC